MPNPQVAPYGTWKSPITPDLIVSESIGLSAIALDGDDTYWLEMRPAEGGRYVIVKRSADGTVSDVTPAPFNARTRVHEYGGGSYAVADGTVFFANFADQRLYRQEAGGAPTPITPVSKLRFADIVVDRERKRLVCIREDHTNPKLGALNAIVAVDWLGGGLDLGGRLLVHGNDFYSSPRLSPDGKRLAWLTWNHPAMPWTGTELWVGEFQADGTLSHLKQVAGGLDESIFQPEWSPDGTLVFVSDRSGWWNLYRWSELGAASQIKPLTALEAEFGLPQWVFGLSTYAFVSAPRLVCSFTQAGVWHLATLDLRTRELTPIEIPYTLVNSVRAAAGRVAFVGASATAPTAVVQLDPATGHSEVLRSEFTIPVDPAYISVPQAVEFPTEGALTAHGTYYAPRNRDFAGPANELPPLLVVSHGGPTGASYPTLYLDLQYWTSRGFALLDVNYGGSTGYGRAYRQRLDDKWGIVDVDDCCNGARYLAERGLADPRRLIIRGGSAGGYTTLAALAFRDVFSAGASYYGVSDLEGLAVETHKFESRYLDGLVGPYPAARERYLSRSPVHHTARLSCPVIFFQGLEDQVVPPNQAERMVEALRAKGLPVAYVPFAGEQHGFRRAENIKRAMEAELYFYARVFAFPLAEPVEPVEIYNL